MQSLLLTVAAGTYHTAPQIPRVRKSCPLPSRRRRAGNVDKNIDSHTRVHAKSLQSCLTSCDPVDGSPPGSSDHGYWSGLLCLPPGDLADPGIEPTSSPALPGRFFTTSATWETCFPQ